MTGHVPFVLTAGLQQGSVPDPRFGIALDGLLAGQVRQRARASGSAGGPVPAASELDGGLSADVPPDPDLPLSRCPGTGTADGWHWQATFSTALAPDGTRVVRAETHHRTARLDTRLMERVGVRLPQHLPEHNGRYRSRRMPDLSVASHSLVWHGIGDPAAVLDLALGVLAVGGGRARGEGTVLWWDCIPVNVPSPDLHAHTRPDGTLGRPCPVECAARLGIVHQTGPAGTRPPYWHPSRQAILAVPAS